MKWLTKQEREVLIIVMILLAVGGGVKVYRASHPPGPAKNQTSP